MSELSSAPRSAGRPRDPEVERRILDVVLRQLAADGYARFSLDNVATEAGVSKPTIYRRWTNKADLATAAISTLRLAEPSISTGTTRGDLVQLLENFSRSLLRPNGMSLLGTVLAEEHHTPELLALFRQRLVEPRRKMIRDLLEAARKRGELRPRLNLDSIASLLIGAYYARYLADSQIPSGYAAEIVSLVLTGIERPRVSK